MNTTIEALLLFITACCNGFIMGMTYGYPIGILTFVGLAGLYRLK